MRVDGVAVAAEGARRSRFRAELPGEARGRHVRSQLLEVTSGHKFFQFAARVWRAHRVSGDPRAVKRRLIAQRSEEGNLDSRSHFTRQPHFYLSLNAHPGANPRGCGSSSFSSSSSSAFSSSPQPRELRRARGSAGRAHFLGK